MGVLLNAINLLEGSNNEVVGWIQPARRDSSGRLQAQQQHSFQLPPPGFGPFSNTIGGQGGIYPDGEFSHHYHMPCTSRQCLRRDSPGGGSQSDEETDYSYVSFSNSSQSPTSDREDPGEDIDFWCQQCRTNGTWTPGPYLARQFDEDNQLNRFISLCKEHYDIQYNLINS